MWNPFRREQWRLVKTLTASCEYEEKAQTVYYHLHESDRGHRKCVIGLGFTSKAFSIYSIDDLREQTKDFPIYQQTIYRWLSGRYDPDIPRYDQIPEEDTANELRGKV